MKKGIQKVLVMLLALSMTFSTMALPAFADDVDPADPGTGTVTEEPAAGEVAPIDAVKAMIETLPNCGDVTEADREAIEAAQEAYEALSAEDQATLDTQSGNYAYETGQPYGRVLETALWGLWSLNPVDNSTTLSPGTYDASTTPALSSSYSKGKSTSSRQKPWGVESITVDENQNVTGIIYVESGTYTGLIYQGKTYEMTKISNSLCKSEPVPIDLNSTFYISGISSSMGIPIAFSISTEIDEPVPPVPLEITNNTDMFKAVSAYLITEDDQEYLVMALSGSGYHELFKGTYEEAVENGDGSAENGNDSWIHGYQNADGKWEFKIPLNTEDTYVPCVAVSNSYYTKYLNGQNPLARVFYPRQFTLDREAKTLVMDDYKSTKELGVTNNVSMFVVNAARLDNVGGPNSNGYSSTLVLTMGSTSYDKMYIGRAGEAENAATTIPLADDNTFSAKVMWMKTAGQPDTITSLIGEPFIASFHSVRKDQWYERELTIDEASGNITFNPVLADYSAVDAALAKVPEDLSVYTEETAQAVTDAVAAVERELTSDKQANVDAMAAAIETAVAGLRVDKFEYDGSTVKFIKRDGDEFGMWSAMEGSTFSYSDGEIHISIIPSNSKKTYSWMHWGGINEELTKDETLDSDGKIVLTVSADKCGLAYPVAPIKTKDDTATTSTQYYLAIPALEYFENDADYTAVDAAIAVANGIDRGLYTTNSLKVVDDAVAAVVRGKKAVEQADVDAMAKAINDAVAGLKIDISAAEIEGVTDKTYNGSARTHSLKVFVNGKQLDKKAGDYTVKYENNVNAGEAKVTITGTGAYVGTVEKTFQILPKEITPALTLSSTSLVYNGSNRSPGLTVKDGSTKLVKGTDYTIKMADKHANVGKWTITVTLKGNYKGSAKATFNIVPKATTLKSVAAQSKAFKVTWKKADMPAAQVTGYQIQWSTDKNFSKGNHSKMVTGHGKTSFTINSSVWKSIKGGQKYYVRICTYKKTSSGTYKSAWSKALTVTTKK